MQIKPFWLAPSDESQQSTHVRESLQISMNRIKEQCDCHTAIGRLQTLYYCCLDQMQESPAARYVQKAFLNMDEKASDEMQLQAAEENLKTLGFWADAYEIPLHF